MKTTLVRSLLFGVLSLLSCLRIVADDTAPNLPVVRVFAEPARTGEPCPTCLVAPAILYLERTGATNRPLEVYLAIDGTAVAGADYQALPTRVEVPAGATSVKFSVLATYDRIVEGPEVIRVRVTDPMTDAMPMYKFEPGASALITIYDNDPGGPDSRLDIIEPVSGVRYPERSVVPIVALGVSIKTELSGPVEFYSGATLIGRTSGSMDGQPLVPGRATAHTLHWTNPPAGFHALTARARISSTLSVTSPPVNVTVGETLPSGAAIVSILAEDAIASETSILTVLDPVRLKVLRSGDLSRELLVFFSVHGSATAGQDFPHPGSSVKIPAGERSATIDIIAAFDEVVEGMETVLIRLEPSPLLGPLPTYEIDPSTRDATAIVLDRREDSQPHVDLASPDQGEQFVFGQPIKITAAAYWSTQDISTVVFYDGDQKIGASQLILEKATPGGLIVHTFTWSNASPGAHRLSAEGYDSNQRRVAASGPVTISVNSAPVRPTVRITGSRPIAEETSAPLRRITFRGEFTVERTGSTNSALTVFILYSGSATPGTDYPQPPFLVTIPAGASSTTVEIVPNIDNVIEGIETVIATLSNCPPDTEPRLGIPCYDFAIEPAGSAATVFIRDDGITTASLAITRPKDGAVLRKGETIAIEAVAIDLEGYISRVEFWDGEKQIGVSELFFFRAPDNGTPIHHNFEWRDVPVGPHELTARTRRQDGTEIKSQPVRIVVETGGNQLPSIGISKPAAGAEVPAEIPIDIVAEGVDPDGYIPKVEFFVDGLKIGESNIQFIRAPDPGQKQTFQFTWRFPAPGSHSLTVRATDDRNTTATSSPVQIRVQGEDALPIVTVIARDAFAAEPTPISASPGLNTATFFVRRSGPTNANLTVRYSLSGSGQNKADYETLPGEVVIPAGHAAAMVVIRPIPDELAEGLETVILSIDPASQTYRAGLPQRAIAVISDNPIKAQAAASAGWISKTNGILALGFAVDANANFRLESSSDLRTWETVADTLGGDVILQFVDDQTQGSPRRFYRLQPETVVPNDVLTSQ